MISISAKEPVPPKGPSPSPAPSPATVGTSATISTPGPVAAGGSQTSRSSYRKDSDDWSVSGPNGDAFSTRSVSSQGFRPEQSATDGGSHGRGSSVGAQAHPAPVHLHPLSHTQPQPPHFAPQTLSRTLPPRTVTKDTIVDAYVSFIFYCNPAIPLNTDAGELRKSFQLVPRSDGNTFEVFRLFELIEKLEKKELKTWAQVAIDLGVEPPALDKGQSAQKVQQYAVRLKRWMHAMHVDAFFEYLLGKNHIYWTHVPGPDQVAPERDGVAAEEDLAIRALLPETRPKRGRRKAEDRDNDSEGRRSPNPKRRMYSPAFAEEYEMARRREMYTPATAHPDTRYGSGRHDPWVQHAYRGAPTSSTGSMGAFPAPNAPGNPASTAAVAAARWRIPDPEQTPMSAYPHSAITPSSFNPFLDENEPRSAITPSRGRSRRRHGPAVSSAWPSSSSGASGKLRGRPPSNRNITDGPFSTFPANPVAAGVGAGVGIAATAKKVPSPLNLSSITSNPASTPTDNDIDRRNFIPPPAVMTPRMLGRPNNLSLQVPERSGAAVRLATPSPPPPTLLVNGSGAEDIPSATAACPPGEEYGTYQFPIPGRIHPDRIPMYEATPWQEIIHEEDATNVDSFLELLSQDLLLATWVDHTGAPSYRADVDEALRLARQITHDIHVQAVCGQVYLINLVAMVGSKALRTKFTIARKVEDDGRTTMYHIAWSLALGPVKRDYAVHTNVVRETNEDGIVIGANGIEYGDGRVARIEGEEQWKSRCLAMEAKLKEQEAKLIDLQHSVMNAVVKTAKTGPTRGQMRVLEDKTG